MSYGRGPLVNKCKIGKNKNFQTNFQRVPGNPSCTHRSQCQLFCVYKRCGTGGGHLWTNTKFAKKKISITNCGQRVPGSPSHKNSQHMPYQYCSAAPIEANLQAMGCVYMRCGTGGRPLVNKSTNSQKYNFLTNFQRVPGSPSCTHRSQCQLFCVYKRCGTGGGHLWTNTKFAKRKFPN